MGFLGDLIRRLLGRDDPAPAPPQTPPTPIPAPPAPPIEPPPPAAAPIEPPPPAAPPIEPPAAPPAAPIGPSAYEATDFVPLGGPGPGLGPATGSAPGAASDPRFDRPDRIPPGDDERTRRIDEAMVAGGFLGVDDLAEIRRVGAAMDRARPSAESVARRAGQAGEAAVEADREARRQLRAARRLAAAERRRLGREAIAGRHATDIVYLGRGVSAPLGDRRSDLDALARAGLPPLSTPADLALAIGLTVPRLRWLAFHAEAATRVHYVEFEVAKKGGGTRKLAAPHRTLAAAQRWVLDRIVAGLAVEPEAHGFLAGRSILTNARAHAGRSVVVNLDLEGFFPSIGFPRVRSVFRRLGYSPAVATILALLCTECPRRRVVYDGTPYFVAIGPRGLPQGACTSPGLSNQVARRLDRRLSGLARKLGATYTRYADDLSFSGDEGLEPRVGYLLARVRHLAGAEGFAVNEAKTRVLRRNAAQVVTGLVVNDGPGVPRDEVRRLRALLHRARFEGLDAQDRDGRPDFRAYVRGKIAYVAMSRPEAGAKLLEALESLKGL